MMYGVAMNTAAYCCRKHFQASWGPKEARQAAFRPPLAVEFHRGSAALKQLLGQGGPRGQGHGGGEGEV